MYRVILSKEANDDFQEIVHYITWELANPQAADAWIDRFLSKKDILQDDPYGRPLIDLPFSLNREYRSYPLGNYLMIYQVKEKEKIVEIVRIVYAKRNIETLL